MESEISKPGIPFEGPIERFGTGGVAGVSSTTWTAEMKPISIGMELGHGQLQAKRVEIRQASLIPFGQGKIVVNLDDVNLFELTREERDRLMNLVDVVQSLSPERKVN